MIGTFLEAFVLGLSNAAPVGPIGILGIAAGRFFLRAAVDRLRTRVGTRELAWVNRASGVMLVGLAGVAVLT